MHAVDAATSTDLAKEPSAKRRAARAAGAATWAVAHRIVSCTDTRSIPTHAVDVAAIDAEANTENPTTAELAGDSIGACDIDAAATEATRSCLLP
jgi:hypothetical protein